MINFNFIKLIQKKFFPFYRNSDLKFVFKKIQDNSPATSKKAMFVGGCVRKHLSNKEIDDIDIATSLTTDQIKEKFKDTKFSVIDTGVKHGTVTLISDKLKLEITTLRKDIETDGRHAEVEYIEDWQKDSERRDFTINAIYLDINGKIFDPQFGTEDLKNNNIKFIGDPQKRIEEDYLRIIRFIRFSIEYESKVDPSTLQAIKLNLNGVKKISKERILHELYKIFRIKNFVKINNYKSLKDIFLLIFPEFQNISRLTNLETIPNLMDLEKESLLAILLVDGTNNYEYFSHKYNVSNELKESLELTAKNFENLKKNKNFFLKDLKKNIYFFGKKHLNLLNIIDFSTNKKKNLKNYLNVFNEINKTYIPKFSYDGNYLKSKGMEEGAIIGKTLKLIEDEWLGNGFQISSKRVLEIIKAQKN